jgi:hypothetical protein
MRLMAPQGQDGACPSCNVPAIPMQGQAGWSDWDAGTPLGVTAAFLNQVRSNGGCQPPDSCDASPCRWWGTLQITNGSGLTLVNAQITVGGVLKTMTGSLPPGASRAVTFTRDSPITASCKAGGEGSSVVVEFSVTNGTAVFKSTLTLQCPPCS